jgi:hypothetical protein
MNTQLLVPTETIQERRMEGAGAWAILIGTVHRKTLYNQLFLFSSMGYFYFIIFYEHWFVILIKHETE